MSPGCSLQAPSLAVTPQAAALPTQRSRYGTNRETGTVIQGGTPYLLGTVFVRRPGRTIQAEPGDIRALEDRFAALAQPIALLVEPTTVASVVEIRPPGDAAALLDGWEARRRGELFPAQPAARKDQPPRVASGPAEATLMEQMAAASAAVHDVQEPRREPRVDAVPAGRRPGGRGEDRPPVRADPGWREPSSFNSPGQEPLRVSWDLSSRARTPLACANAANPSP
jgi:hypothetical protein